MLGGPAFPLCWLETAIQLPYFTYFASIWEYQKEFDSIDWAKVMKDLKKDVCPVCKKKKCNFRHITAYARRVTELVPDYQEGVIYVGRFQCRKKMKTFSLLPAQLVPYCRYTIASMLYALLVAERSARLQGLSLFSVAEKEIEENSRVTGCTLAFWLGMVAGSFRRNHAELGRSYCLDCLTPGHDQAGLLFEIAEYCKALGIRGPPQIAQLDTCVKNHVCSTGRFLFGVASQYRVGVRVS